jgi:predicted histidine transporter YuiF (NhaC family)
MDDLNEINFIPTHMISWLLNFLPSSLYEDDPYDYDEYYNDISKGWYEDVGYTIIIAIVTMLSAPLIAIVVEKFKRKYNEKKLKKVKVHMVAKKCCKKTVFELSKKYAQALLIICVCYIFSSGMPILLFVGFIVLTCTYYCIIVISICC